MGRWLCMISDGARCVHSRGPDGERWVKSSFVGSTLKHNHVSPEISRTVLCIVSSSIYSPSFWIGLCLDSSVGEALAIDDGICLNV
jgi:hypothetical protein